MSAEAERVPPGGEAEEMLPVEEPTESLITLRLGTEWYGLSIVKARTVVRVGHVTPLPSVPPHVIGIVNLRGEVLSVTDLRRLFGLPPAPITVDSRLVIVEDEGMDTALLADEVSDVVAVPVTAFEPPLSTLDAGQAEYVERMCRWQPPVESVPGRPEPVKRGEGRLIAVLRVERLLSAGLAAAEERR